MAKCPRCGQDTAPNCEPCRIMDKVKAMHEAEKNQAKKPNNPGPKDGNGRR